MYANPKDKGQGEQKRWPEQECTQITHLWIQKSAHRANSLPEKKAQR